MFEWSSVPTALDVAAQHLIVEIGAAVAQNLIESVPVAGPPRFAEIESPTGVHRVLAIFTADALPGNVLDILLKEPIDTVSLNHTATVFQHRIAAGPEKCRILSRRFVVAGKPA